MRVEMVSIIRTYRSLIKNRIPGQIVIQVTDRCNAKCPQCGMRVTESFPRSTLETDTIKKIIDAAARQGVMAISFTGGEPLLDIDRLSELIRYAGSAGIPYIRTGTNGFMFARHGNNNFFYRIRGGGLADTPLLNFWISLDSGVDACHEKMRGFPGVVAGIEKALPIFHEAGIYPAINLGINRNVGGDATRNFRRKNNSSEQGYLDANYLRYLEAFERFFQRIFDMGFTIANVCYPMSIDASKTEDGLRCRKCDWECFRDPSEMFGPLLDFFSRPVRLLRRLTANPGALGTWFEDLQYYRACNLFDGRRPPDTQKLARFSSTSFHPDMQSIVFSTNSH